VVSFFTGLERNFDVRSSEFTTLLYIKRKDFLDLLKEFPKDYEKFCSLKDSVKLYSNFGSINCKCFSCGAPDHLLNECPLIHFRPHHGRTITRNTLSIPVIKNQKISRKETSYYTLKDNQYSIDRMVKFHQDYEIILD
jgi:hypothetical protein